MAQRQIHIPSLVPGQKYILRIRSVASDGNMSQWSEAVPFAAIKDITPPEAVVSASLDFSTPTFIATWDTSSAKASSDFKNFKVILTASGTSTSATYYTDSPFILTYEENYNAFGSVTPKLLIQISSQDNYGNLSDPYSSSVTNLPPSISPSIVANSVTNGFTASWSPVPASFNDYSYTELYTSATTPFNASAGTLVWRGTNTYANYSQFGIYSTLYVKARHFDIFGQAGPDSNTASVTPIAPVVLNTNPPSNGTSLTASALNDSTGTTSFSGQIIASWTPSTASNVRGYRLRIRQIYEQFSQYENTASNSTTYHIGGLIPGETYEVALAAYDELNNTSSYTLATPSAVTIPYGTASSQTITASAAANSNFLVFLGGATFSSSMVGQLVTGYGLLAGTIITGSITSSSVQISINTGSLVSGSPVTLYPGMSNWRSYITAGSPGPSSSYMKLGTGVSGTQSGLYLNDQNYWYTSGNLRVGTSSAYLQWDGTQLTTSGNIVAKSGSFDGNVQITQGSLYAGSSPTANPRVIYNASGIVGYTPSGSAGFLLDANTGNLYASSAYISGSIIFTAGYVGGWTVDSTSLYNASVGIYAPVSPANSEIAIFAGSAVSNRASAPFRVSYGGGLVANSASISGTISASSGVIGGWTISPLQIGSGTAGTEVGISTAGTTSIWAGGTNTNAPFRVTNTGSLVANSASISGLIIANSGSIGGWTISSGSLSGGTGSALVGLIPNTSLGGVAIFAGSASPTSAPFSVTNTGSVTANGGLSANGTIKFNGATFTGIDFGISSVSFGSADSVKSTTVNMNLPYGVLPPPITITVRGASRFFGTVGNYYGGINGTGTSRLGGETYPSGSIISASLTASVVKIITSASHGLITGDTVRIERAGYPFDNDSSDRTTSYSITTTASTTSSFTYSRAISGTASATVGNWYALCESFDAYIFHSPGTAAGTASGTRAFSWMAISY